MRESIFDCVTRTIVGNHLPGYWDSRLDETMAKVHFTDIDLTLALQQIPEQTRKFSLDKPSTCTHAKDLEHTQYRMFVTVCVRDGVGRRIGEIGIALPSPPTAPDEPIRRCMFYASAIELADREAIESLVELIASEITHVIRYQLVLEKYRAN